MSKSVVITLHSSTGLSGYCPSEYTAGVGRSGHDKSGRIVKRYLLKLALHNDLLKLDDKQRLNINGELNGNVTKKRYSEGLVKVSAGRLSPKYQQHKARLWYYRFRSDEQALNELARVYKVRVYRYLLTINGSHLTPKPLKSINSKVTRILKKNHKVVLIYRANGIAPTYVKGKPNLDYHVHYKVFTTSRVNKRNLVRTVKQQSEHLDVSVKRINPKHDRTDGYLADQRTNYNRFNKSTNLTYFHTFMTFNRQTQKKLQLELYQDHSRPFSVYTTGNSKLSVIIRGVLKTKRNRSLSLFNGKSFKSIPQTSVNHHHWTKLELWRHHNGLNIYTGQLLQRTYKHHQAFPVIYHQQLSWNIDKMRKLQLFDAM